MKDMLVDHTYILILTAVVVIATVFKWLILGCYPIRLQPLKYSLDKFTDITHSYIDAD